MRIELVGTGLRLCGARSTGTLPTPNVLVGGLITSAALVLACLLLPTTVLASTHDEPTPLPCNLGATSVVAGQPLTLSGSMVKPEERVSVMARNESGADREGTVAMVGSSWRSVILFGAEDAGIWKVEVSVDGISCVSPLAVTLPAGVVIPATRAPTDPLVDEPAPGLTGETVWTIAGLAAAAALGASIMSLIWIRIAGARGARPLRRRAVRAVARSATFVVVLGGFLGVASFFSVGISLAHFDSPIPSEEKAILDLGMWAMAVGGAAVGTIAALRIRGAPAAGDDVPNAG